MKKTLNHPKACEEKREAFKARLEAHRANRKELIFIDESGFAHHAPRLSGYSEKGQRCYGRLDWGAKGRINAIGAQHEDRLLTISLFEGTVNSDVFYAWVTGDLLHQLPSSSVLVLDNASFHKRQDILDAIEEKGHAVEFLPPYSPDLNPIEHKWAQAKAIRRKQRCDIDTLFTQYIN